MRLLSTMLLLTVTTAATAKSLKECTPAIDKLGEHAERHVAHYRGPGPTVPCPITINFDKKALGQIASLELTKCPAKHRAKVASQVLEATPWPVDPECVIPWIAEFHLKR